MDPLIQPVLNLLALICGVSVIPVVAVVSAALLAHQLGWFGFSATAKKSKGETE